MQDEPANMGAWPHMRAEPRRRVLDVPLEPVSRPESSSPSVGQHSRHLEELRRTSSGVSSVPSAVDAAVESTGQGAAMYFTDRGHRGARGPARRRGGHPGLARRRGCRSSSTSNPEFEVPVERLATWLARLDDPDDPDDADDPDDRDDD